MTSISPEMIQLGLILLACAVAGIVTAAFTIGLYVGERGRRKDAYRREGRIRVDEPEPAEIIEPGRPQGPGELAEAPAAFVRMAVEEGLSEEEAREEWRSLSSRAMGDSSQGWMQEA